MYATAGGGEAANASCKTRHDADSIVEPQTLMQAETDENCDSSNWTRSAKV